MFSVVLITKTNSLRGQVALPAARLQGPVGMKYTRWSQEAHSRFNKFFER